MTKRVIFCAILFAATARAESPKAPGEVLDGPPVVTAKAWAVADGATGKLLWGGNDKEPRAIASTTKVMTAWLVLKLAAADPKVFDETVTYSERAAKTTGTSTKLLAGDRLSVRELLYGLLLPSGNDAAVAFAEHFGPRLGSGDDAVAAFVAAMNDEAKRLGLAETSYLDPNGLGRNLSSARDLVKLAFTVGKDERLCAYVRTRHHECEVTAADGSKRTVAWDNTNKLLDIDGYDGMKTGTTNAAGSCLIATGTRGADRLLVVILGSTSNDGRYADSRNLFRWAWRERERPLAGAVIVVDPGHGGQRYSKSYTGGTRGRVSGLTESELNLRVAFELARALTEKGAAVTMTRTYDRRLSREGSSNVDELHARIDYFERDNPHFFLSVHHNAGNPGSGHTALYKHNAADDTLYEAIARDVNDALEGAVPGPKLKLIKGSYHILRETDIPGTISESGFMTNADYDRLAGGPEYPKVEAESICRGAVQYWTDHKAALAAPCAKLAEGRAARPRDPKTVTATDLNPEFQAAMKLLLAKVAPGGSYEAAKAGEYVAKFKECAADPAAFAVTAEAADGKIKLGGGCAKADHDRLIDLFVAMRLTDLTNAIAVAK